MKVKRVQLKRGHYSLVRQRDLWGESGLMFRSLNIKTGKQEGEDGEIIVGCVIQCGSLYARTFSERDWIMTTPVEEILEVNKTKTEVTFKTRNSTYVAKSF